jgi:hypothetical protein
MEYMIFLGAAGFTYGVVNWIGNLRRGEDLATSLTHGPALIVFLIGFLLFVGGGSWLIWALFRVLSGS